MSRVCQANAARYSGSRADGNACCHVEIAAGHHAFRFHGEESSIKEKTCKRPHRNVLADGWSAYVVQSVRRLLFTDTICVLLPFVALALVSRGTLGSAWTFTFALLGMVPLAERLGVVTEQLAHYTNPTLGGLVNATFGNATELIVSMFAIRQGMVRIVQLTLLGSVLSNMLLVLGCAFWLGGWRFKSQRFGKAAVIANSGVLLLGVMTLILPNILHATHTELKSDSHSILSLSRWASAAMLGLYGGFLYFQLVTHRDLYEATDDGCDDDDDEDEFLGPWGCIVWLGMLTALISILSDFLVDALEGAARDMALPLPFISTILLPIVGNAAEHAAAIMFALKNKMEISIGVAVGSSTQITVFVIPLMVVVGWAIDVPMDLNFHAFETAVVFVTVFTVVIMIHDGESNWFKGMTLTVAYVILAVAFLYHIDPPINASALPLV